MQTLVSRRSLWIMGSWADVQERLQSLIDAYGRETTMVDLLRLLQQ